MGTFLVPMEGHLLIGTAAVILIIGALWGWDCYRLHHRPPSKRKPCGDEDQFLDALAMEVDRLIAEEEKAKPKPAPGDRRELRRT